jgi:hypothetical protein
MVPVGRPRPTHSCPTPTPDRLGTRGAALRSRKCRSDALRGACRETRTLRGDSQTLDWRFSDRSGSRFDRNGNVTKATKSGRHGRVHDDRF